MPASMCSTCSKSHFWRWEEAFDRFGFADGDGPIETETVANVLRDAGYVVRCAPWGLHNVIIDSIVRCGRELIPWSAAIGYDDPRGYLPDEIIKRLDEKLPMHAEVVTTNAMCAIL